MQLARVRRVIETDGAALLRIERSSGGAASVEVGPGVPAPAWIAPAGETRERHTRAIALPSRR